MILIICVYSLHYSPNNTTLHTLAYIGTYHPNIQMCFPVLCSKLVRWVDRRFVRRSDEMSMMMTTTEQVDGDLSTFDLITYLTVSLNIMKIYSRQTKCFARAVSVLNTFCKNDLLVNLLRVQTFNIKKDSKQIALL